MFVKHFIFAFVVLMGLSVFSSEGQSMFRYDFPPSVQVRKWVGAYTVSNLLLINQNF